MRRVKYYKLARNRRAVSAVVSNMILIAAVICIGLIALAWSQTQSADYQKTQTNVINNKIIQLKERLSLEYAYYDGSTLKIYLLNSGLVDVKIEQLYLSNAPTTNRDFVVYQFSGTEIANKTLGIVGTAKEGYIQTSSLNLVENTYSATIKTAGGSTFVFTFAV